MKAARAALIACVAFVGCANLSSPSASADLIRGDPILCEQAGDRLCIGKLWLYVKFKLAL